MRERGGNPDLARAVRKRLNAIQDPCSLAQGFGVGLDDMGLVNDVTVSAHGEDGYDVEVRLRTTAPGCLSVPFFEQAARRAIDEFGCFHSCSITWESPADWTPEAMSPEVRARLAGRRRRIRRAADNRPR